MDAYISDEGQLGRIAAISDDRMHAWVRLANGYVVTASASSEPFLHARGDVVLLTGSRMDPAPAEAWEHMPAATDPEALWVGVVSLCLDDVTIINVGSSFRRVPTSDVPYERGNTVEGTDSTGVRRVLDPKPIRYVERDEIDDADVAAFRHQPSEEDLDFDNFGGLPDVVDRARELIELKLRQGEKFEAIRARPIKGVLFTGLPGTGKTMLARIIAKVSRANFYEISGPAVISKWVGESEELLRRIFEDAAKNAPSIIFFDEIDSVAGRRTEDAHEASKRVVAQLLTLMDGFEAEDRVTIIAATNRPQDIDVALRRPGRFDWEIEFPLPDLEDREAILRVSARELATDEPLPYRWVASNADGWSAADLAAIWSEAALVAVADDRDVIMTEDVVEGHARVETQRGRITVVEIEPE